MSVRTIGTFRTLEIRDQTRRLLSTTVNFHQKSTSDGKAGVACGETINAADASETNMGAWAAGLYSSDIAADMRATIKSVLRLPFDEDRIVEILSDCERDAASDPGNEDHTTFWLVLADQFEKRGVAHAMTRDRAIAIIDGNDDLRMMESRGMKPADLKRRGAKLGDLRTRLASAPRFSKPRATISAPDVHVPEPGGLYARPVHG